MSTDLKHTCHECGSRMAYPDHAKGMEVNCPNCGKPTSLGEMYPANPAPTPAASSAGAASGSSSAGIGPSASPVTSSAGTTSGHSAPAGFAIAGRHIGWPVLAGSGLIVVALCVGLFFFLRPINVAGHLYVVTRDNSVKSIADTQGWVLNDRAMQVWVSSVNAVTAKLKSEAEKSVIPLASEHDAAVSKLNAETQTFNRVRREGDALEAKIDGLLKESGLNEAEKFANDVADISTEVVSSSPLKKIIGELLAARRQSLKKSDLEELASFAFETNVLRHASNTLVIARANQTKVLNAYRQQGQFGDVSAADVRGAYNLSAHATNAFLGISNLVARTEELRLKRVEFGKLQLQDLARMTTNNIAMSASREFLREFGEKNRVGQIQSKLAAANKTIGSVPLYTLQQVAEQSESARNFRDNLWRFQTDVEGKMLLRLPKKGVYHLVTIVKHLGEDLFLYKRVELTQGRDHKVTLNQKDNRKLDYEAWDSLGFKVRAPEMPPLKLLQ